MKYLVEVIYKDIVEVIDGVEKTRKSDEVESYKVRYKTTSYHKPRGKDYIFLLSEYELDFPIVSTDEEGDLILIEDPVKMQDRADTKYQRDRKSEYESQGLTFDSFVEMLIENDAAGMAAYRNQREAIKLQYPKPVQGEA